jgi:hypothetical protein
MFVHAGELRRSELHQAIELIHIELLSNARFLKYGTQKFASDASALLADDPTPRIWLDG